MTSPMLLVAFASLLAGCTTTVARMPGMTLAPDAVGVKRLRPTVRARACAAGFGFGGEAVQARALDDALAMLRALDPEAGIVTDVTLRACGIHLGVWQRRCVTLVGDLGRPAPLVRLPAHDHGGHSVP